MMLSKLNGLVLITGLLSCSLWAAPQDPNAGLEKELLNYFVPTKIEKSKIVKAGSVFVVQMQGIGAISQKSSYGFRLGGGESSYPNIYTAGTITHDPRAAAGNTAANSALSHIPGGSLLGGSAANIRDLDVNEQVYVTKVEVKDAAILIGVQSCGKCDPKVPDPTHLPARATVLFQFGKDYLSKATPAQVEEAIGTVFATPGADNAAPATDAAPAPGPAAPPSAQPAAPAAPMAEIPPPPPPTDAPPAPPVELKVGQTMDQVKASLGAPVQIFNLGKKVIYKYKDMKITFVDGKVSDIE